MLFNPNNLFGVLAPIFGRLRPAAPIFIVALLVGLPTALYLYFTLTDAFRHDLHRLREGFSYLKLLLINLLTVNLLRCFIQGLVCAGYGTRVPEFGILLRFGVLPRFYIDKSEVRNLGRSAQLWIYGTSPLLRLALITVGILLWAQFRNSGGVLAIVGAWAAHAGLVGLIFVSIPLWNSDGYRWLVAFFYLHPRFRQHSMQALFYALLRKPLPSKVPVAYHYRVWGLAFLIGWTLLLTKICITVVRGLERSFPLIYGYSTHWIFVCAVLGLLGLWLANKLRGGGSKDT